MSQLKATAAMNESKLCSMNEAEIGYNEILLKLFDIQMDLYKNKTNDALTKIAELSKRILKTIDYPTNVSVEPHQTLLDNFKYTKVDLDYDCCKNCPNNPSNGGSGICNCTLPYFEKSTTYSDSINSTLDLVTNTRNGTITLS